MNGTVYLNGRFIDQASATVSVSDGGFLHGAGLFETMPARSGRIFRLESHMERLCRSATKILLPIERSALPGDEVFWELLERNQCRTGRVRMTVTAGTVDEIRDVEGSTPTVCVTVGGNVAYPSESYERGVRAAICDFRVSPSDPVAGHKTVGHLPRLLALRRAQRRRCFEALWFTTENFLAEGSITNVFVVSKDVINTPSLDTPVLPGIARGVVLELAAAIGLELMENKLTVNDLLDADEVLLTNALLKVMPVVGVEKRTIGEGVVGPVARELLAAYQKLEREECGSS